MPLIVNAEKGKKRSKLVGLPRFEPESTEAGYYSGGQATVLWCMFVVQFVFLFTIGF